MTLRTQRWNEADFHCGHAALIENTKNWMYKIFILFNFIIPKFFPLQELPAMRYTLLTIRMSKVCAELVWKGTIRMSKVPYTVCVQIFKAHNFHGFRRFQQSAKIKLAKFYNTEYSKLLIRKNCFRKMFGNSNPRNLSASKIWTYTVCAELVRKGTCTMYIRS